MGAGNWLLQFGRCRLPSQSAPEGTPGPSPEPDARRPRPARCHGAGDQPALLTLAWPSRGSKRPPVPSLVPSRAQVGYGGSGEVCVESGDPAPLPSCWVHLVASVQVCAGPCRSKGLWGPGTCSPLRIGTVPCLSCLSSVTPSLSVPQT